MSPAINSPALPPAVAAEAPQRFRTLTLVTPTGFRRTFGSKNVPDDLVEYSWRTAHQPGADRAPFAFLSKPEA